MRNICFTMIQPWFTLDRVKAITQQYRITASIWLNPQSSSKLPTTVSPCSTLTFIFLSHLPSLLLPVSSHQLPLPLMAREEFYSCCQFSIHTRWYACAPKHTSTCTRTLKSYINHTGEHAHTLAYVYHRHIASCILTDTLFWWQHETAN